MLFLSPVLWESPDTAVLILNSYCTLVGNEINAKLFLCWYFIALTEPFTVLKARRRIMLWYIIFSMEKCYK